MMEIRFLRYPEWKPVFRIQVVTTRIQIRLSTNPDPDPTLEKKPDQDPNNQNLSLFFSQMMIKIVGTFILNVKIRTNPEKKSGKKRIRIEKRFQNFVPGLNMG